MKSFCGRFLIRFLVVVITGLLIFPASTEFVFAQTSTDSSADLPLDPASSPSDPFQVFLECFEKGTAIPESLLLSQVHLARVSGSFFGVESFALAGFYRGLILKQQTSLCSRYFLLVSDGRQLLDQKMISERCLPAPGDMELHFSSYQIIPKRGIIRTDFQEKFDAAGESEAVLELNKTLFLVNDSGLILLKEKSR